MEKRLLVLDGEDNVGIALDDFVDREIISIDGGARIKIKGAVQRGHKVAIKVVRKGEEIVKYGKVIGISKVDIEEGEQVHIHNMESRRGMGKSYRIDESFCSGNILSKYVRIKGKTFDGFRRSDGRVGVRNLVPIVSTVVCANSVVRGIADGFRDSPAVTIGCGCGQMGLDIEQTERTLTGLVTNPNLYGVVVVELGCQEVDALKIVEKAEAQGVKAILLNIQKDGGSRATIEKGRRILKELHKEAKTIRREKTPIEELVIGIECGGSDWTSGITANLLTGIVTNSIIEAGGSVIFGETAETIGMEGYILKRIVNNEDRERYLSFVRFVEDESKRLGVPYIGAQPGPGNMAGGITTIEEKSVGAVIKSGVAPISGVLCYGERIKGKGLFFMDSPGQDAESLTGMVASGAVMVLFTTGRGTPLGNPIAPVIKITGNHQTFINMRGDIDFSAHSILEGRGFEELASSLIEMLIGYASGKKTSSERLRNYETSIFRCGFTI